MNIKDKLSKEDGCKVVRVVGTCALTGEVEQIGQGSWLELCKIYRPLEFL